MNKSLTTDARRVRRYREALGMTQVQLALGLRVCRRTVQCWERSEAPVPYAVMELLRLRAEDAYWRSHMVLNQYFKELDDADMER